MLPEPTLTRLLRSMGPCVPGTPTEVQQAVVARARQLFEEKFPDCEPAGACLFWAWVVCCAAKEHGVSLQVFAGTMFWPRVVGPEPQWFGYPWDPTDPGSQHAMEHDLLPCMHVWAGSRQTREWVDLSVRFLPAEARRSGHVPWTAPEPPDFLWCSVHEPPEGVVYLPVADACAFAASRLTRIHQDGLRLG